MTLLFCLDQIKIVAVVAIVVAVVTATAAAVAVDGYFVFQTVSFCVIRF